MNKSKENDKPSKYVEIHSPGARGLPCKAIGKPKFKKVNNDILEISKMKINSSHYSLIKCYKLDKSNNATSR
jgi:hypothetical protein